MCDISFVILTWNSENVIKQCLESISKICLIENIDYKIHIIDNGSKDNTSKIIRELQYDIPIDLILLKKNAGTTVSRNIALKRCKGDIVCVLDSDTEFNSGNISEIWSLLQDHTIGIVAPQLILFDSKIQNSVKKFPSLFGKFVKIPKIIFQLNLKDYDFYDNFPFHNTTEVDTAISACWFFRRDLLNDVGLLDERIFYSPEDVDFCIRIRKAGKKILYYPNFQVLHYTQQITHKKYFNRIALSHLFGLLYYFMKHKYIHVPKLD